MFGQAGEEQTMGVEMHVCLIARLPLSAEW